MKTKPPFDGEIHAVSAKTMPDLNTPKREPGWFLGDPTPDPTPTRDEAVARVLGVRFGVDRCHFTDTEWADAMDRLREALASAPAPASGGVDAELVRAASALLGNLWQDVWSHDRTHEENWKEFDRKYPGSKWLRDARNAAEARLVSLSPAAKPVSEAGGEPYHVSETHMLGPVEGGQS